MRLFIEPVDVWLFRDGRPFSAGSDHRAQSLFPPYPSVMQGVVRSHHLIVHSIDLTDRQAIENAVGTATDYRNLRLRGPFVARHENGKITRYFPVPADAVWHKDRVRALTPQDKIDQGIMTSAPTPLLLWDTGDPEKPKGNHWLSQPDLEAYLLHGQAVTPVAGESLFRWENRLGIGLDDETRTTRRVGDGGLLYEVAFIRPCEGVGLEVEAQGLDGWPPNGVMRMGGEGRAGRFGTSNASPWPQPAQPLPQRFKIYFATPTYFEEGWQPKDWSKFFQGNVILAAAAVGRYESIGGFDWAKERHKSARRYVPAGSVYFFKCQGQVDINSDLVNGAITDTGAEIGLGQIIIGRW